MIVIVIVIIVIIAGHGRGAGRAGRAHVGGAHGGVALADLDLGQGLFI